MRGRLQTGALPWRRTANNGIEVMLVTSRWSSRWIVPKGWPMRGKSLAQAAAQEAFEEGGVRGSVEETPLGSFRHTKHLPLSVTEVDVLVHPLAVRRELAAWPERGQRERKWLLPEAAADAVESDELRALIFKFKEQAEKKG